MSNASASDTHDIIFRNNTNAEKLRIASTGQVSISSDGTTDGLLTIKGDSDQVGTPSIRLLDGSDTREVSITNTSGDFVASVHGNDNAIHGHIKMFESGIFDINSGGASGSNTNRLRIASDGQLTHTANKNSGYTAIFNQSHADNPAYIEINSPTDNDLRPAYIQLSRAGSQKWGICQVLSLIHI